MGNTYINIKKKSAATFESDIDRFAQKLLKSRNKFDLYDEFKALFEEYKHVQKEFAVNSRENFVEIKRQINIQREKLIEKIDETAVAMIKQTEEYEEFFQEKLRETQFINEDENKCPHVDYKASVHRLQTKMDQLKFISSQMEKCSFEAK